MAQIIKHRRGTLESLSSVTGSLLKGEIVIATGSSNIAPTNGESVVFVASSDGRVEAVNRIMRGTSVPNVFAAGTYNGLMEGVPFYASGSGVLPTLYLFGSGVNEAIDLVGNIQPFSTSVDSRLDSLESSIGGGGNLSGSIAALNSFTGSTGIRLSNLESKSASVDISISNINSFTSSQQTKDSTLASYTASIDTKFSNLASYTGSNDTKWTSLQTVTSSVLLFTSSTNTRLSNIELTTASILIETSNLELFSASQNTKNLTLASYTGSIDTKFTTLASYTGSVDTKFSTLGLVTSSLISKTGSYATTGSNLFYGTQTMSGSVYVTGDLVVYGSSSIQNISASNLIVGNAFITLNTNTPSSRFAGFNFVDSGSLAGTGSLYYDSVQDEMVFIHKGNGVNTTSSVVLMGPQTYDSLGNEIYPTQNRILKSLGLEHVGDSQISDDGTTVTITGALTVGTLTGIGVVSTFSSSVDSRLDNIEASLGGGGNLSGSIASLNTFTASQQAKDNTLATYTASVDSKFLSLATYTGSIDSKFTTLASVTASLNASTASQQISIDALNTFSASQISKDTTLGTYTSSIDSKFTTLASYTGSVDSKFTTLQSVTSSILSFTSSQEAKNLTLASYTGSNDTKWSTLATYTGSVNSRFTNIESATASLQIETANLELFTSSQNTKNLTLATYTGSVDTKFSNLATYTGSVNASLTSINSYTSSLKTAFTLAGSDVVMNGNATIAGDLVVQGSTVTFNTTTLVVEDKLIELASGSTNATQANGAGISVLGAGATFTYESTKDAWTANRPFSGSAFTGSLNVPGGASSKRIAFRGTTDNIEFVAAPTTAGDLVQWDGSGFVMSNVIDGGSF
jgi:spore maturation protein SpmB